MKGLTIKTAKYPPLGGVQLFNPKYREMDLTEAIEESQILDQYAPYGYTTFLFCKSTGIIHCYK